MATTDKAEDALGRFIGEQIWEQNVEGLLHLDDDRVMGMLAALKLRLDAAVREQFERNAEGRLVRRPGAQERARKRNEG